MDDRNSAAQLRRRAMVCADLAQREKCSIEQERLLKMREALLMLAETEDWLAGERATDSNPRRLPVQQDELVIAQLQTA